MVSAEQLEALIDFLEVNPQVALGRIGRSIHGRRLAKAKWKELADILNRLSIFPGSVRKDGDGWRTYYNEYKSKLTKKIRAQKLVLGGTGGGRQLILDPLQDRLYAVLGSDVGEPVLRQNQLELEPLHRKQERKGVVFAAVKQACVDLVKKHGHPITLIDEEAFRSLIQMMPMSMKEKDRITSEYIQKIVDTNEDDAETIDDQEDHGASDEDDKIRTITVKAEIEEVPCHCDARVTEGGTKSHTVGCPAAARQPYWNYFEVTPDKATCSICDLTFRWTNVTKLKDHLLEKHPTAEFVDDTEEFSRGPGSDVWTHEEDTEEIYLEDFDDDPLPPVSSRKRKRFSEPVKSRDERPEKEKSREEPMREMKQEREKISAARMKAMELEPDRFKSLDVFGMYVAELMKLIPKDKCMKYQVQIVQRLLQEQAAAG